jgi:hypothetical protein
VKHFLVLLVGFLFAMACTATIAMAQATGATSSLDMATLVGGLPLADSWKQIVLVFFTVVVAFRWIAELLFGLAKVLNRPAMGSVATAIYKTVRAIGAVFGYFGVGTPTEMVSMQLEAAMKGQAKNDKTGA